MRELRGGGSLGRDLKTVNTGLTEFAPEREVMQKQVTLPPHTQFGFLCYDRLLPWGHQTPAAAKVGPCEGKGMTCSRIYYLKM